MKYQELGYSLPKVTAKAAANRAIAVLKVVEKADASCLFYVLQASNVLALAGLRAESPYNDFEPSFSSEKQSLLSEILHKHGYEIMMCNRDPYEKAKRISFSLMCRQAFMELPERYKIAKSIWKEPQKIDDLIDFFLWSNDFQLSLVDKMEYDKLPKDWLLCWWAPHNIRFGMMLGYPGQAIASLCWDEAQHIKDEPTEKELEPTIPFQGIYCGTHVKYGYTLSLKNNPVIVAHQKLWSDVLTLVYEAFPESRTMKIPEFKAEYNRYKKYDESN